MAKRNGKQKERTRSITLDLDVSEIAQKLADKNELSSTLSELLRQAYGFGDKIEEKKRALHRIIDEKNALNTKELELELEINTLEEEMIAEKVTILPQLVKRLQILEERKMKVMQDIHYGVDPHYIANKKKVLENITNLINECKQEMEEFQ